MIKRENQTKLKKNADQRVQSGIKGVPSGKKKPRHK